MIKKKNNIITGIKMIAIYIFLEAFTYIFPLFFGLNYNNFNTLEKQIYLIFYNILTCFILIYVCKDELISNLKKFKQNYKIYLDKYIKYWILTLILMILSNYIITLFTVQEIAQNQEIVVDYLTKYPIYMILSSVLFAPIIEELIFRFSIRKFVKKNKIIYILVSGLLFGACHVIGKISSPIDYLFIIPYSIPGFCFAYIYQDSDNILVPISMHIIHNSFMVLLQFI